MPGRLIDLKRLSEEKYHPREIGWNQNGLERNDKPGSAGIRSSRLNRSYVMNVMKVGGNLKKKEKKPLLHFYPALGPSQALPHPVDPVSLISIQ